MKNWLILAAAFLACIYVSGATGEKAGGPFSWLAVALFFACLGYGGYLIVKRATKKAPSTQ